MRELRVRGLLNLEETRWNLRKWDSNLTIFRLFFCWRSLSPCSSRITPNVGWSPRISPDNGCSCSRDGMDALGEEKRRGGAEGWASPVPWGLGSGGCGGSGGETRVWYVERWKYVPKEKNSALFPAT
jgi:hypothetical protein